MTVTILRLPAVKAHVGLSKTSIYDLLQRGEFPRPVRLGARAVGWKSTDLDHWMATRPQTDA